MKNKKLTLDQEIVLSCAVRYALGRQTYVVSSVCSELIKNEPYLPLAFKERVSEEIQEYQDKFGQAGASFDNDEWNYVKWLFDKNRRVKIKANKYETDEWVEAEAVKGEDGKYYSLEGKNKYYHTAEEI